MVILKSFNSVLSTKLLQLQRVHVAVYGMANAVRA